MTNEQTAMTFSNGLSPDEDDRLDDLIIECVKLMSAIEDLGRHRSYSLALTKIEEAKHWLRDRKNKPA
ncbi:MAG: hypothetical protein KF810_16995 [Rhizobiaceae bacterium]|nr:hypothetical protein [Rhizobiaceae bacterium]